MPRKKNTCMYLVAALLFLGTHCGISPFCDLILEVYLFFARKSIAELAYLGRTEGAEKFPGLLYQV